MTNKELSPSGYLPWIDVLKGIGIICVVIGHVANLRYVYLFHMPLFFMLAGYTFRPVDNLTFVKKKTLRLLVPYVAWLIILTIVILLIDGKLMPIYDLSYKFLYGGVLLPKEYGAFWFSTVLFSSLVVYNSVANKCGSNRALLMIVTIFLLTSYVLEWRNILLPECFHAVPMAVVYIHIGKKLHELVTNEKIKVLMCKYLLTGGVVTIPLTFIFMDRLQIDMKIGHYGIPFVSLAISVMLCIYISIIAKSISKVPIVGDMMIYIGKASMAIMFAHQLIHWRLEVIPDVLLTLLCLCIPLGIYLIAKQNRLLKRFI